jgi:tetratricopeptide (TPR) repeat protein
VRIDVLLCILVVLIVCPAVAASDAPPAEVTGAEPTTTPEPAGDPLLMSNIHVWKGDELLRQGQTEAATESYLRASQYMRTSPDPHFALARAYLKNSLMDSFLEFATGLKLLVSGFFHQSIIVSNLLIILIVAIGGGIYVAVLVIVVRHARTMWLSATLSLPLRLKGKHPQAILMGIILAFFVLVSGLSIIGIVTWVSVIGCGLVWRFASVSEKRSIVGFAIFLIALAFFQNFTSAVISTQHPESPLRLAALADRIGDQRLESAFGEDTREARYDPIAEFMQGFLSLKSGEYAEAIEHFNIASKFTPNNAAILNNLGVAYHRLGRHRQAESKFQEALRFGPREAVIYYNRSQTLNSLLRYDEAEQALAKASALDFELTRSLMTGAEDTGPVPLNLQTRVLWQLAIDGDDYLIALSYHPVETGLGGAILLILLTGLAAAFMRRAKCPARCEVCSAAVETQLTRRKRRDVLCPRCLEIKIRNAGDHRELEQEFDRRLARLQTREMILRIIGGLVIPGSTYHLSGRRFKGFAVSVVIFALLVLALNGGALLKVVPGLKIDPIAAWPLPLFIVVYALYAWRSSITAIRSLAET